MEPANSREYGRANLSHIDGEDELLKGIHVGSQIWMSHGDTITVLPDNFKVIASTDDVRAAAYHVEGEQTWGVQFHPEFKSRPNEPHPLFCGFIGAALKQDIRK